MKVKAIFLLMFFAGLAHAGHDSFWYAYPMPQAYLYVQNPVLYRMWEANYGYGTLLRSPAYQPVVVAHDRGRLQRRACEIRVRSAAR
jgi:hypothetical protein